MKFLGVFTLVLVFFSGCRENEGRFNNSDDEKNERKIEWINAGGLEAIINNRNGKTLLINVWATWCKPCIEEFPHLVKIAEDYKNKNLEFLSLSVDFGKKADSLVADFIDKQNNPDFPVYIVAEKSTEKVIELLNKKWDGAIPATFIYDDEAQQKSFILGSQNYSFFKKNIDSVFSMSL
jgi:thiol-disulfide isomerase/thioredoxin